MKVLGYAGRRLLWMLPTLVGALIVIFFLTQALPGNAAMSRVGQFVNPETIAQVKHNMGLDKTIPEQFVIYVGHLFQGDFGHSWKTGNDVIIDLGDRLPATIELTLYTLIIAIPLGILLGTLAAATKGSWFDRIIHTYVTFSLGIPVFWLSLMLVYIFFFLLGLVPSPTGRLDILDTPPPHITGFYTLDTLFAGDTEMFGRAVAHMLLPVLALVFVTSGPIVRVTYSTMSSQLTSDHIRAATASGLSRWKIVGRYALKNAMIPVITAVGLTARLLLGGAVLIEIVFSWPGIGRYAVESLLVADLAPLQAVVLITTILTLLINLVVDVSYFWFDPRIKVA
jgi:peptide/nickel transport system permease protein